MKDRLEFTNGFAKRTRGGVVIVIYGRKGVEAFSLTPALLRQLTDFQPLLTTGDF